MDVTPISLRKLVDEQSVWFPSEFFCVTDVVGQIVSFMDDLVNFRIFVKDEEGLSDQSWTVVLDVFAIKLERNDLAPAVLIDFFLEGSILNAIVKLNLENFIGFPTWLTEEYLVVESTDHVEPAHVWWSALHYEFSAGKWRSCDLVLVLDDEGELFVRSDRLRQ